MNRIYFTDAYERKLSEIEDFIFQSTDGDLDVLEKFIDTHEIALRSIQENPDISSPHPQTGDQSWPFADGRYRIFYKVTNDKNCALIYMIHIIDNRQLNKEIYPSNTMPSYFED